MKKHKSKPLKNVKSKKAKKSRKSTVAKKRSTTGKSSIKRNSTRKSKSKLASKNKKAVYKSSKPKRKNVTSVKSTKSFLSFEYPRNPDYKRKPGNVLIINLPQKTFNAKINALKNWSGSELNKFINRYSKFPQAVQIILTTKKRRDTFQIASRISSYDFVVDLENTKKFVLEMMYSFQDNYIEYIEDKEPLDSDWVYNPSKIISITIRFIY